MSAALAHTALGPGAWIADKYELCRELGRGGMGVVYQARHAALGTDVAIKVVLPEHTGSKELCERLLQEARSAARIRNEHAVRVLDYGTLDDGCPFIVMEYLEGEPLAAVLARRGRLNIEEVIEAVAEACSALDEAHAAGVIHRDLKPENLFLARRADGTLVTKVVDFGVSKQLGHGATTHTHPSLTLGSPEYMSPEQMQTPTAVDARSDLWSLGVVLYELSTGRTPFASTTLAGVFSQVLCKEPAPPSRLVDSLPAEFDEIVLRCLRRDPALRFQSARELAAALRGLHPSKASRVVRKVPLPIPAPFASKVHHHSTAALLARAVQRRPAPFAVAFIALGFAMTLIAFSMSRADMPQLAPFQLGQFALKMPGPSLKTPELSFSWFDGSAFAVGAVNSGPAASSTTPLGSKPAAARQPAAATKKVAPAAESLPKPAFEPWNPETFGGRH